MKLNKNILALDYIGQSLLIGAALVSLVTAVVFPSSILYTMILGFFIGSWQVISAFLISIFTVNKQRLQYLLAVIAFFLNAGFISYFGRDYVFESELITGIIWAVVPAIYAFWYYKITRDHFSELNKKVNSSEAAFSEKEFV